MDAAQRQFKSDGKGGWLYQDPHPEAPPGTWRKSPFGASFQDHDFHSKVRIPRATTAREDAEGSARRDRRPIPNAKRVKPRPVKPAERYRGSTDHNRTFST